MFKRILKILFYCLLAVTGSLIIIAGLLFAGLKPAAPDPPVKQEADFRTAGITEPDSGLYVLEKNWIRKNRYGLWEMYIEGEPFERGVAAGLLSKHLVEQQEIIFVSEIQKLLPSKHYRRFLMSAIAWLNRNLTDKIPHEYLEEIYGISLSASPEFNDYGPPYLRLLNYHAAHDIGHAMQSYYLVGCSSFAAWNDRTKDSSLIVGRNFDFYFGDDFARNKIIEFVSPDSGYNFAFITWGGMIGVVSGMNDQGLTVTINAGTMDISARSSTPVTLVAREILQYAAGIDDAIKIAKKRNIMVAETFLISSAKNKKAVIIEKKPEATSVLYPDSALILCTNHFQVPEFYRQESNIENKERNATGYRMKRLKELIREHSSLDPNSAAEILRDKQGLKGVSIGYGNEKALNQMLAHHSVIFEPEKLIIWVSTSPNVMGNYLAYDLNRIFSGADKKQNTPVNEADLTIPADPFIDSREYTCFLRFRALSDSIKSAIENDHEIPQKKLDSFVLLNPDYFETYLILGDYYFSRENYTEAGKYYKLALTKEYNSRSVADYLDQQIAKCN
jgi:predicted choloylglycine hydrolase